MLDISLYFIHNLNDMHSTKYYNEIVKSLSQVKSFYFNDSIFKPLIREHGCQSMWTARAEHAPFKPDRPLQTHDVIHNEEIRE